MIQPLRSVHRRMFIVLAGVLPVILWAGLKVRHRVPLPKPDTLTTNQGSKRLNQVTVVWTKNTFDTKLDSAPADPGFVHITLKPLRDLDEPDLLLYWTSPAASDSRDLTAAHLLGPFSPGKSYSLPSGTQQVSLVLYSLAHGEIVDSARIEGLR